MKSQTGTIGKRVALIALVFVGALTIGLGFYRIQYQVARPFASEISRPDANVKDTLASLDANTPNMHTLKKQDTDGDGLSDYDELYVFHTSPYLADTDSDGYDDKTEIMTGHDPNCPGNKVCFTASPSSSQSTAQNGGSQSATQNGTQNPQDQAASLQAELQKAQSLTPDQVRQLLKQKGFTDAQLGNIDDTTLMNTYKQSLQQAYALESQKVQGQQHAGAQTQASVPSQAQNQTAPAAVAPTGTSSAQPQTMQDFAKMSKAQIIQMLSDTGQLSQSQISQLNTLDESTVRTLFLDSLQKAQAQMNIQTPSGGQAPAQ